MQIKCPEVVSIFDINFQLKWRLGCGPEKLVLTELLHTQASHYRITQTPQEPKSSYWRSHQLHHLYQLVKNALIMPKSTGECVFVNHFQSLSLLHTFKRHIIKYKWLVGYFSKNGSMDPSEKSRLISPTLNPISGCSSHFQDAEDNPERIPTFTQTLSPPKVSLHDHNPHTVTGSQFKFFSRVPVFWKPPQPPLIPQILKINDRIDPSPQLLICVIETSELIATNW